MREFIEHSDIGRQEFLLHLIKIDEVEQIEWARDTITYEDTSFLLNYYWRVRWKQRRIIVDLVQDQQHPLIKEVMLDFIRIPDRTDDWQDLIAFTQTAALCIIHGNRSLFMNFYEDRDLLKHEINNLLIQNNLNKDTDCSWESETNYETRLNSDEITGLETEAQFIVKQIQEDNDFKHIFPRFEKIDFSLDLEKNPPEEILSALRFYIDALREKKISLDISLETQAYYIGHTIAIYSSIFLNWNLSFLESKLIPEGEVAVISKDRSYVFYPALEVYRLLTEPRCENSIMATINMCKEGIFPKTDEAYTIMMG